MLIVKIVICILTFVILFISWVIYDDENKWQKIIRNILVGTATVLGIIFCVLLITTNWNLFTIPKILLFISVFLYILFKEEYEACVPFWIAIVITIFAYIVAFKMYMDNIETSEIPDIKIKKYTLVSAKDGSSINGNMNCYIMYSNGTLSERPVYKYYYKIEDGGIRMGTIPADSTTIYFLKDGEEPYLEKILTTSYAINNNDNPPTRYWETTTTTYKLYVPESAVTNAYEFNAE